MNWPAYREYQESSIPWVHALPVEWQTAAVQQLFSVTLGKMLQSEPRTSADRANPYLRAAHVQPNGLSFDASEQSMWFSPSELSELSLRSGDVVVVEGGAGYGRSATLNSSLDDWGFQNSINRLRPQDGNIGRFADYCIQTALQSGFIEVLCGVATIPHLTAEKLGWMRIPNPPPETQRAICNLLDRETAKIDALIAKQEQLIATLREDRTATITRAITSGLDPHVDLVQPHDTALPVCPKHWTHQISLKRVADVQTGLTLGKSVDPDEAVELPYLRVANVQTSGVDLDEVKTVAVHRSEVARYLLRSGDVLMTEGGDIDKLGRGCVWSGEISPCIHQNHVFAVRCKNTLSSAFLAYLLDTAVARNYFFMTAKKTTNLASTNSTTLGAFTFSLPPRPEQDQIVKHLNERCTGLDALIAKSNTMISALREYRSALITDAVTGKIDVRGAA